MKYIRSFLSMMLLLAATCAMAATVSVNPLTVTPGGTSQLVINLTNSETTLTAYQMTLTLPTGVSVKADDEGDYVFTKSSRHKSDHTVTLSKAAEGCYLIVCFSTTKKVIGGTSGELLRIDLDIDASFAASAQGSLTDITFSDTNKQKYTPADVNFSITVQSPIINFADANVKALCVANWDTDGDEKLSEAEAAAVTDLGEVFKSNTNITSFDELQYFTGLTSIGDYAFYNCSGLTSVTIPNSVTSIGKYAFFKCSGLTSVSIPNSVTSIAEDAFYYCSGLTSVSIPNSVTSIAEDAFNGCSGLTSVTIPNSVTSIGERAFFKCSGLTSVTIPNSVTSIGDYAFIGCSGMTSISVASGNTKYDSRNNCNAIIETASKTLIAGCKNTIIPNSVESISTGAFYRCSGLTSVTIPNSVTSIGSYAFQDCSSLTSVSIPNSVTSSIGDYAFDGCSGLSSVTIGNSVTSIGGYAFSNCSGLTSVTIPNSVTSISTHAFYGCSGLTSVTIPNSVTSIGRSAFHSCSSLTSVVSEITTPFAFGSAAFYSIASNCTLTVPAGTRDAYIAAGWTENVFKGGIFEIDNHIEQTLELTSLPAMTYGDAAYTLPQKTTEGLTLTWSVDNAAVASVSGNTLTIVGAGSTTVTATQAGNDDYSPFSREFALTVNKAVLTITADDKMKQEGEENPELTVTYSGFVNGDNASSLTTQPTVSTTATKDSPAGTYPITASGAASDNYEFTYVNGTLTVTEKPAQTTVEVTDISQMDNVIYIEPMEARTGTQAVISFKMKNTAEIRSFQFDLCLPEGVTPVKSSKGRIQGSLSAGRLPEEDEHTLTFSEHEGGIIRFLCDSQYGDTFTGNDGEIATLQVNIAETMADGDYAIVMKDMKLSEVDIANYYQTASLSTRLSVSAYLPGDINNDGVVDVSDYSGVASHIHENTPAGFNLKAADVDESGNIDVSDYSGIANIIHYGSIHGSAGSRQMRGPRRANTDVSQMDNVIYIKPFTAAAGTQATISICMKNTAEIRSFQFDLCLPEGMTAVKSSKGRIQGSLSAGRLPEEDAHTLTFSEHEGGIVRFLCDSEYGDTFTGNDGEIATLQVNIAETMADGDYAIVMKGMKLSEVDIANYYVADDIETTVTIGETGTPILGDVNNDGSVTPADAIMILYAYFGVQQTNFNEAAADLNGDNDITPADAIEALYKYFGAGSSARAIRPTTVVDSRDPE